jgi:hypothetical protein
MEAVWDSAKFKASENFFGKPLYQSHANEDDLPLSA